MKAYNPQKPKKRQISTKTAKKQKKSKYHKYFINTEKNAEKATPAAMSIFIWHRQQHVLNGSL